MNSKPLRSAAPIAGMIAAVIASSIVTTVAASDPVTLRGATLYDNGVTPAHIRADMSKLKPMPGWKPGDPIKEIPQRKGVPRDFIAPIPDPRPQAPSLLRALQNRMPELSGGRAFDVPMINQDGQGFSSVNPPDTIGDVGNDYYIQMINGSTGTGVLILDKTDGTPANLGNNVNNPFLLQSLAIGSGTGCTAGSGDPILMFDETVDNGLGEPPGRWFLTEFTGNSFCVYISQTADPTTGDWFLYEFGSASGGLPDYPKWGVWPDAYYIGANERSDAILGDGVTVYAFDRENMLLGLTTRPAQIFEVPELTGFGFQMLHPADWDGRIAPPDGAPGLFFRHRDDEVHNIGSADGSQDFLEIWEFSVDWDSPGNSAVAGPTNIGVEEFDSGVCGLTSFACVPQPGSNTLLDPLREPMMWRVQYRNFGSHQALVGTWVTDVDGTDLHGVRWAELRNTGAGWNLFQEGLVSPDEVHRFMASIAMDGTGNIALGYNVSDDTSVFPGLRYIGRLVSDALDTMPRGEFTLVDGSGSNASNRYGDYSAMVVDPVDECTFWFTGEYNTGSQWSTRIGSFRFDACGEPGFFVSPDPAVGGVCIESGPADFVSTIDVGSIADFVDPVTVGFDPALPSGFTADFSVDPVVPGNSTTLTLSVDETVAAGEYPLTVLGTATGADDRTAGLAITVEDVFPSLNSTTAPINSATDIPFQPLLEWTAALNVDAYLVEIATDVDFNSVVYSATETGTTHQVATPLASSTQYFWRVTPTNTCGDAPATPVAAFTTQAEPGDCPIDEIVVSVFEDDMENGENGWTLGDGSIQNTWQQTTTNPFSGTTAWNADNVASRSDQRLDSPPIHLPPASLTPLTLRFQNFQEIEDDEGFLGGPPGCWDAASLEISTDGGSSWTQLQDQILFREYDFVVNAGTSNPLSGSPGWCGDPREYEDYVVDLSSFAGEEVQLRFRLGTDGAIGPPREGWTIDDVRVEACGTELLFKDGFELQFMPSPL